MIEGIAFYVFALSLLFAATMTVTVQNPVHAVLFLILSFASGAGVFLMLGAEFIAFIMLIVYVGAIAVMFLFVVMMLHGRGVEAASVVKKEGPLVLVIGGVLLAQMLVAVWVWPVQQALPVTVEKIDNTRALGNLIYTHFALPFQVSGLILLVAIIGAIVLTLQPRRFVKRQKVQDQLRSDPKDVVELRHVKTGEGAS